MAEARQRNIAQRFADAAEQYDEAADIQRQSADFLAAEIAALPLPPQPRLLELGCGPGTFTRRLCEALPDMQAVISDIAPAMVTTCRSRLTGRPGLRFVAMNAEQAALAAPGITMPGFDLICANFAMQWFLDLHGSLARLSDLLRPNGFIAFTTLGRETFQEWRAVHADLGLLPGTPDYPDTATLTAAVPPQTRLILQRRCLLTSHHDTARDFLLDLRRIGADLPAAGARPLSAGSLRQVLRRLDARGPVTATYDVVTIILQRI